MDVDGKQDEGETEIQGGGASLPSTKLRRSSGKLKKNNEREGVSKVRKRGEGGRISGSGLGFMGRGI